MYLKYFEPISNNTKALIENLLEHQIGKNIDCFNSTFPYIEDKDLVLIGIGETSELFRLQFYKLSHNFKNIRIADLGNLKPNCSKYLNDIIEHCLSKNTLPIIISNSDKLLNFLPEHTNNNISNIIVVDKDISLSLEKEVDKTNLSYSSLLLNKKIKLFNFGLIGYQSYYINSKIIGFFDKQNYDYLRLGTLKKHLELSEPLIRDADFMGFNLAALKKIEVPSCSTASPSGLFVEEACQLTYYAGISDKMRFCNIYGYDVFDINENQTPQAISQMVWYFIYGYYNRKHDYPVSMNNFIEFIVNFKTSNYQVTFWKSTKSDRWWMEVPVKEKTKIRHRLIPCSYNDYLEAGNGNLPERLLNAHQRFE